MSDIQDERTAAMLADMGILNAEVNRLCGLHDGRLVMAALLSSVVDIGSVLHQNGQTNFVIDAIIAAATDATDMSKKNEVTRLVLTDGQHTSEKRQ